MGGWINEVHLLLCRHGLCFPRPEDEQIDASLSELTFFGKGLGASFTTPALIRDSDLPYALEITYFNLSHKIGIFSLFANSIISKCFAFSFLSIKL